MKIYQVGGSVRDMLRGQKAQDFDYVITGTTPEDMLRQGFIQVGKDFPVFLHPETKAEYALARKEIKTGCRHTDFRFIFDPSVTLEEDLERRDFTCNAIAFDPEKQQIIDPFNGQQDIQQQTLRHINTAHFQEDPLRILRLCRFTAQLGYKPAPETLDLVRQMTATGMLNHLTPERIWKELEKALHFPNFPQFIQTARDVGALQVILPEIERLWQTPERTDFHPEGNSGAHTLLTLQQATNTNAMVRFGLLLHDIGKTLTPANILPSHHQHEQKGPDLIRQICWRLKIPNDYKKFAIAACRYHMSFHKIPEMRIGTLVDFCTEIGKYGPEFTENYIEVCRADMLGCLRVITTNDKQRFNENADKLRRTIQFLSTAKATDMPNFASLPKDARFKELYRQYKIKCLRKSNN